MKELILFTFLSIFSMNSVLAETLKGTVLDAKTKEPVVGANVYLDGTTIGTISKRLYGKRRVGDLLPADYTPSPGFENRVYEENIKPEIKERLYGTRVEKVKKTL
jgi:hypothetical protein